MSEFDDIIKHIPIIFSQLEKAPLLARGQVRNLPKKGVYVFYENSKPIYVGRSRNIPNGILIHSRPSSGHNSASFAFLLAKEEALNSGHDIGLIRAKLEKESFFKEIFSDEKNRVAKMRIKAIRIENPETQAIFEIYASKTLKTRYNDFDTH